MTDPHAYPAVGAVTGSRAAVASSALRPGDTSVVSAAGRDLGADLRELWRYRELLAFLAWRDVRVRYRQTLLGAAWALLEPLGGAIAFTLIFHRLAGIDTAGVPYILHCYAGLVLWTFVSRGLRSTTLSLVANAGMATKAYFPRLVLPLAAQLATTVDFALALATYAALAALYRSPPTTAVLTLPLWIALAALAALGPGLLLGAVNVRFRDISQALSFLTQLWLLASPVAYPLAAVPERWQALYALNPLVAAVEGLRWALLPGAALRVESVLPGVLTALLLLLVGLAVFRRAERGYADIV